MTGPQYKHTHTHLAVNFIFIVIGLKKEAVFLLGVGYDKCLPALPADKLVFLNFF